MAAVISADLLHTSGRPVIPESRNAKPRFLKKKKSITGGSIGPGFMADFFLLKLNSQVAFREESDNMAARDSTLAVTPALM